MHAATYNSGNAGTDGKVSWAGLYDFKMVSLAQMRKPFLKKGLISTVSWKGAGHRKKKSRKSGSQGKTGRKIRPIHRLENCLKSRENLDEYSNIL
ncbi:hypothetical protein [Rhizobium leguminosarum]|uniref:hypothetical protein n=1 Tax=Rhizobium leguminosarum TaxID=384 RepID=UPI000F799D94|nr:hypothetical protein [Rhizobium leguminosarum]